MRLWYALCPKCTIIQPKARKRVKNGITALRQNQTNFAHFSRQEKLCRSFLDYFGYILRWYKVKGNMSLVRIVPWMHNHPPKSKRTRKEWHRNSLPKPNSFRTFLDRRWYEAKGNVSLVCIASWMYYHQPESKRASKEWYYSKTKKEIAHFFRRERLCGSLFGIFFFFIATYLIWLLLLLPHT